MLPPIKHWFSLILCCYLVVHLPAQSVFIPGDEVDPRGHIVSQTGETLFRTPPKWYLVPHGRGARLITEWPAVFQFRGYQRPRKHAVLTEEMEWQPREAFTQHKPYEYGYAGARRKEGPSFIIDREGQSLMDSVSIGPFSELGLAVSRSFRRGPDLPSYGLLDTKLHWHWPPVYTRIQYLQQDRYLVTDSLGRQAVLDAAGTIFWPWQEEAYGILRNAQFDDSGHIFVYKDNRTYSIKNKWGKELARDIQGYISVFASGMARTVIGNRYGYLNPNGELIVPAVLERALPFTEGRALALDSISRMLGYLDTSGRWAIPPQFTYGTSFLDSLAIVAGDGKSTVPKNVKQGDPRRGVVGEIGNRHVPGFLRAIDPEGQTLWSDSCRSVQLLPGQLLLIHYNYMTPAPAYRLISLKTKLDWIPATFTLTDWQMVDDLPYEQVSRMDVGLGKMNWNGEPHLYLPDDYQEQLARLPGLRSLAVGGHILGEDQLEDLLRLEHLTHLSFEQCGLTSLPKSIRQLAHLEELDLSKNQLTELPRTLYRMRHLRKLNIADNPLPPSTIPRLRKALPDTEIVYKREW